MFRLAQLYYLGPCVEIQWIFSAGKILETFSDNFFCLTKAAQCKNPGNKKNSRFVSSLLFEVLASKAFTCDENCSAEHVQEHCFHLLCQVRSVSMSKGGDDDQASQFLFCETGWENTSPTKSKVCYAFQTKSWISLNLSCNIFCDFCATWQVILKNVVWVKNEWGCNNKNW